MRQRRKELFFPFDGVSRQRRERTDTQQATYPSPWGQNVRAVGPFERRLRGGSRPGLTKFFATDLGTTIADIVTMPVGSLTGASEQLVVLVDSTLKVVTNGVLSEPLGYLTDESDNILTDESDTPIVVSTADAPSSAFLVTGQQKVVAVDGSSVLTMDSKSGAVDTLRATKGTVPTNSTFGAVYRDRLFLSGEDNAIYTSRQGDWTDWDFGQYFEDSGRAVAFQLSLSSAVGDVPTAMIAHNDRYLMCASRRSLWLIAGDPTTGTLQKISDHTGIVNSRAWVRVDDRLYFLAEDGLYRINMDGSGLTPLSEQNVPAELRDVAASTRVLMGYERDRRCIHIYVGSGREGHWNFEIPQEAFWPVRLQTDHVPAAICQHKGELILAGADGYARQVGGDDDDGSDIDSHVVLGPFRLGENGSFGRMDHLHGMTTSGSGDVTWRVVVGDTADEAGDKVKAAIAAANAGTSIAQYVHTSGTWGAGRSDNGYPRSRGVWCCLWLQSSSKWAYEGAVAKLAASGRWRG